MSRPIVLAVLAGTLLALTASSSASHAGAVERQGTIAFIRMTHDRVFGGSLFVVRPDGTGLRRLTPKGTRVVSYAWSPTGGLIAYLDQHQSLWFVRPDGSGRRLVLDLPPRIAALSWSPDGTRIAITTQCPKARCSRLRLYVVPTSGRAPVQLPTDKHLGWGVSWSPRGDEIYYSEGGIWAIRPDGTGRRKISAVGSAGALSADGRQFAFGVAIYLKNGVTDRYRAFATIGADGKHFHVVTTHAYNEYGVAWSPHGLRILYGRASSQSNYRFHSEGIYVNDPDSRHNHRVTGDSPPQAGWGALAWSPDGGSIVYDTGPYKNTDLYVIGVDGRNKVRLTDTPEIDIAPSWVAR